MNKKVLVLLTGLFILMSTFFGMGSVLANDKTKVIYAYMDDCRMCKVFESKVLSDPEVREALSKFIFEKIDATTGRVNVAVTPTILVFNKNNKLIRKLVPSLNKEDFLEFLRKYE